MPCFRTGMPPDLHVYRTLFYPTQAREASVRVTHSASPLSLVTIYRAKSEYDEQAHKR